jgi:hypothetical protein
MIKKHLFFLLILIGTLGANGQPKSKRDSLKPVQISAVVFANDTIPQSIPYANVIVKNRNRGTMSNAQGFFSFATLPGDTLVISCLGFKKETLIIPDTLKQKEYLARVLMFRDTTLLAEVTLYPWPTPERFRDEFLATRVPTTENDIAMRNLAIQELKARAAAMGYSAEEMQDFMIQSQQRDIYNFGRYQGFSNGGTAILGSLTNPFAWQEFFRAIKRGDFKSN